MTSLTDRNHTQAIISLVIRFRRHAVILTIFFLLASCHAADHASTVYFYRYKVFHGSLSKAAVYIDGTKVGTVRNGDCMSVSATPGMHEITGPNRKRGVRISLESGRAYYFKIEPAAWSGWVFGQVTEEQGEFEVGKIKEQEGKGRK